MKLVWAAFVLLGACASEPAQPEAGESSDAESSTTTDGVASESTETGNGDSSSESTGGATVGEDAVVDAFVGEHFYYLEGDDQRIIDVPVEFPMEGSYEAIDLHIGLRCPDGGCDDWDRIGWIGVVQDAESDMERVVEVARFITPFKLEATWEDVDVTALRPLLSGEATLRAYMSTGVGPGHPNGAGWLLFATFEFRGGVPESEPIAVIPLWNETVTYGDPAQPVEGALPPVDVELPEETTSVEVRTIVTGHGQGNLDNCAEFCSKLHGVELGGAVLDKQIWRDDCPQTAVPDQPGTWQYARAGWCPGAMVTPWVETFDDPTSITTARYAIEPYENTCRPDSPRCEGCALGNSCDYNGGTHTSPRFLVSSVLVAFK